METIDITEAENKRLQTLEDLNVLGEYLEKILYQQEIVFELWDDLNLHGKKKAFDLLNKLPKKHPFIR